MDAKKSGARESLHVMFRTGGRSVGWWQLCANLTGAITVTSYFVFFDQVFPAVRIQNTFYFVGIMFPFMAAIAFFFFYVWRKDINRYLGALSQNRSVEANLQKKAPFPGLIFYPSCET